MTKDLMSVLHAAFMYSELIQSKNKYDSQLNDGIKTFWMICLCEQRKHIPMW